MKGLVQRTETGTVYVVVKHGTLCEESKTEKPGFAKIEVDNPRTKETVTKFIKAYSLLEGLINQIEWYDTKDNYEQRYMGWKIHMDAAGTPVVLDLPLDSRPASRFMRLAENIDFNQPVEFRAWTDTKTKSTAFFVGQNGKSVPQKYTRETPHDCPAPTQDFRGNWDFSKPLAFLYKKMISTVIPAAQKAAENREIEDDYPQPSEGLKTQPASNTAHAGASQFQGSTSKSEFGRTNNPSNVIDDDLDIPF